MAEPIGPRITGVENKVDDIKRAVESIGSNRAGRNSSNAIINFQAGGVVLAACAFMLGVNFVLSGVVIFHALKIEDLDDKLSAIYMMAPHLQPEKAKPE